MLYFVCVCVCGILMCTLWERGRGVGTEKTEKCGQPRKRQVVELTVTAKLGERSYIYLWVRE